jgi:hypothetical protein
MKNEKSEIVPISEDTILSMHVFKNGKKPPKKDPPKWKYQHVDFRGLGPLSKEHIKDIDEAIRILEDLKKQIK